MINQAVKKQVVGEAGLHRPLKSLHNQSRTPQTRPIVNQGEFRASAAPPPRLPPYEPPVSVERLPEGADPTYAQSAQFAPVLRLADGRLVVDIWVSADRALMGKVWTRADHPNLAKPPANAPRAVRSLYKADGQLAYLRGDYDRAIIAMRAWEDFWAGIARHAALPRSTHDGRGA